MCHRLELRTSNGLRLWLHGNRVKRRRTGESTYLARVELCARGGPAMTHSKTSASPDINRKTHAIFRYSTHCVRRARRTQHHTRYTVPVPSYQEEEICRRLRGRMAENEQLREMAELLRTASNDDGAPKTILITGANRYRTFEQ